jgi:hypothetical protein
MEDPRDRARAAVALARIGDARAIPHLPEAAHAAESRFDASEAVRRLGVLGGREAFEPLVELLDDFDTRRQALVALGTIRDPRVYDVLVSALGEDTHASMRDSAVMSLGQLGDPRAIPVLVELVHDDPGLRLTTEALVRLDAIGRGAVGGADLAPRAEGGAREGIGACEARPADDVFHFRDRTSCETNAPRASIPLAPAPSTGADAATVIVRMRRVDAADATAVSLGIGAAPSVRLDVDGSWSEQRFEVARSMIAAARGELRATFDVGDARVAIDHVLLF